MGELVSNYGILIAIALLILGGTFNFVGYRFINIWKVLSGIIVAIPVSEIISELLFQTDATVTVFVASVAVLVLLVLLIEKVYHVFNGISVAVYLLMTYSLFSGPTSNFQILAIFSILLGYSAYKHSDFFERIASSFIGGLLAVYGLFLLFGGEFLSSNISTELVLYSVIGAIALGFIGSIFQYSKFGFYDEKSDEEVNELSGVEKIYRELTQPFFDLAHTSQALFGLNLCYVLEGLTYFGVVGLLAIFFNQSVGLDDVDAGRMVGVLTGGITLAMLFLGATVDWIGIRKSLLLALGLMFAGRILLPIAPGMGGSGMWSAAHIFSMLGILGIILGYGIYQPAAYAAVKKFTTEKTAAMGYAMLYALMNLGGFLPGLISPPVRKGYGIEGVFYVYAGLTILGILVVTIIMTRKAIKKAVGDASGVTADSKEEEKEEGGFKAFSNELKKQLTNNKKKTYGSLIGYGVFLLLCVIKEIFHTSLISGSTDSAIMTMVFGFSWWYLAAIGLLITLIFIITDPRFVYFIFILIFVQTLFAHNWLTIPQYTSRAFDGFVSDNFEFFTNLNPIFIFVLTPIVTAFTAKKNTYNMMILGTFVMAAPTFLLVLGPNLNTLLSYLVIMTIGEAMWQPRFLQWVAEIAPKNMTGIYMGIGQFPWFLTKVITSLYSGYFLMEYCPIDTLPANMNTEYMWLIYGVIAMVSPVGLLLAKGWMQKGFKTKHEG